MELRQLRYFVAVARSGNFGRASDALHITQPALSRQIQKLEDELGAPLFVRRSQGVEMTPQARGFMSRAQSLLDDVDRLRKDFSSAAGSQTTVSISISPGTSEILSAPLLQIVAQRCPTVRLHLLPALLSERQQLIVQNKVAFAVMNAPPSLPGIQLTPLMQEPLCLICRPDDRRFAGDIVSLEDVVDVPLVVGGFPESGIRGIVEVAAAQIGRALNIVAEVGTAGASKPLVLAGAGPTIHVAAMARSELSAGQLKAIPIRGLYSRRVLAESMGVLRRQADVSTVIACVHDCLAQLVDAGRWPGGEMLPWNE
jgi:LysR family nitrogen assimilation transcriptional regulator